VAGFKALRAPARIELRPLTVIAGANSGGKSSAMQPLLLMKQTLEASYDPGPLLLDGPHVQFTLLSQLLSRGRRKDDVAESFQLSFGPNEPAAKRAPGVWRADPGLPVRLSFRGASGKGAGAFSPAPAQVELLQGGSWVTIAPGMSARALAALVAERKSALAESVHASPEQWEVVDSPFRSRVAGGVWLRPAPGAQLAGVAMGSNGVLEPLAPHEWFIRSILHLPGLRGHRERRYNAAQVSVVGDVIVAPGPFTPYAASVLAQWQDAGDGRLQWVHEGLRALGLSAKVVAKRVNAAELELKVSRLPALQQGGANDLVDIADVGFGVSQVLPVLVALAAAVPGQLVYVEQPELHLHPRAQVALGRVLADAAARGVCVVTETHSRLVLRAIQTALAEGSLQPEQVGLHWFSRDPETGFSTVKLAELDQRGAFGEWPVDFSDVEAEADEAWLERALAEP
jgi:hypothetical protein